MTPRQSDSHKQTLIFLFPDNKFIFTQKWADYLMLIWQNQGRAQQVLNKNKFIFKPSRVLLIFQQTQHLNVSDISQKKYSSFVEGNYKQETTIRLLYSGSNFPDKDRPDNTKWHSLNKCELCPLISWTITVSIKPDNATFYEVFWKTETYKNNWLSQDQLRHKCYTMF